MRSRLDSRPLYLRPGYTAALRSTQVLAPGAQVNHGVHLFFVIAASVIARNVANQELLDAVGSKVLGSLYVTVSVVAGLVLALLGYLSRGFETHRLGRFVHGVVVVLFALAYASSLWHPRGTALMQGLAVARYIGVEIAAAALLLAFGVVLGSRLGPRDARRTAARVGLGGILGGLAAGAVLKFGAVWLGSRSLFIIAGACAFAPIVTILRHKVGGFGVSQPLQSVRADRSDVKALAPYGRWVAISTMIMVAVTTLIDYQYRAAAAVWYDADRMTAFFGEVTLLTGVATLILQLTVVDRLLDKFGLFATATVMPGALIICSAAFGLTPTVLTLVVLKLVDSGTNMTVQQATGGLLLAPLGSRARAIWQSRIDGLAKRGGQAVAGLYLSFFPLAPARLAPVTLVLCATWLVSVLVTRLRYVSLLTELLAAPTSSSPEVQVVDGSTLRLLLRELETAMPARAAVILDLLEQAGERAPEHVLTRLATTDATGAAAVRVVEHLAALDDHKGLVTYAESANPAVASAALTALAELAPEAAARASEMVLIREGVPDPLRALAAGILINRENRALSLARSLAEADDVQTRQMAARALGLAGPPLTEKVTPTLIALARDASPDVARTALSSLARHPSPDAVEIAIAMLTSRELRGASTRTLVEIGIIVVPRVANEIIESLGDTKVAVALCTVLGRIGSSSGVKALVAALKAPHVETRLAAASALGALKRRSSVVLPADGISATFADEIAYFGHMRDGSLCDMPKTTAAELLRRAFKERAHASLETLFRSMALIYPEDAIQGAYRAMTSRATRDRQIALELLDNILDASTRDALVDAVGERGVKRIRDSRKILTQVARSSDKFSGGLARVVLVDMGAAPKSALGDTMTQLLVNQVLELQGVTLFSQSSAEDLAEVATLLTPRNVPAKSVLYTQGDQPDLVYLVRSGAVELTRDGRVLDRLGPGDAAGLLAVLDQLPRETTATTVSDCSLLVVSGDAFVQLLADRPTLMHGIFRALTGSIRNQLERTQLERKAR